MRTKLIQLPLVLVLLSTLVSPLPAQAGPPAAGAVADASPALQLVGQIGGVTNVALFASVGGHLYVFTNIGPRIARIAVSNTGELALPPALGVVLPGIPEDLAVDVDHDLLYAALGPAGVAVVDAVNLTMVGSAAMPPDGVATELALSPERLYVAAGSDGVASFSLGADFKTLTLAGTSPVGANRYVTDVAVWSSGGTSTLYAAVNDFNDVTPGGVYKYNITSSAVLDTLIGQSTEVAINGLAVTSSRVYGAGDEEIAVWNAATMGAPTGSHLLNNPAFDIVLRADEQAAYLLGAAGIDEVNIHDPAAPDVLTQDFATAGFGVDLELAQFIGIDTTFLYVADGDQGFSVVTATRDAPQDLDLAGPSLVKPAPADTQQSTVGGGQAYAISGNGNLWTISNTVPSNLSIVGNVITPSVRPKSMVALSDMLLLSALSDGLIKMPTSLHNSPGTGQGFASPGIIPGDYAHESVVVGSSAMVADGQNGLAVVRVSDMVVTKRYAEAVQSNYQRIDATGNTVYVVDTMDSVIGQPGPPTFRIIDVANPAAPDQLGSRLVVDLCGEPGVPLLRVSGHFAFLGCGANGIRVVDLTHPNALVTVDNFATAAPAQDLFILGNNLYAAEGAHGFEWLTFDASGTLTLKGAAAVAGEALDVMAASQGNTTYVYVSTGAGGLQVFEQAQNQVFVFLPLVRR